MGDFGEEEGFWSYEKDKEDSSPAQRNIHGCSSSAWGIPSAPRRLKRVTTNSVTSHENKVGVTQTSSAPVNIPDWSKIYGTKKHHAQNGSWVDNNGMEGKVHDGHDVDYGHHDDDGDDDEMVPPHEWLAKKLARSQISSFSVCEGVGRTLKGRDLSKVRNAVLTKTGFLE